VSEAARQQKPNHVDGRDKPGHYGNADDLYAAVNARGTASGTAFDDDEIRTRGPFGRT
jgi:hypothetical protein